MSIVILSAGSTTPPVHQLAPPERQFKTKAQVRVFVTQKRT